jgi:signal transduction histidine kinase
VRNRLEALFKVVQDEPWAKAPTSTKEYWRQFMQWFENHVLLDFMREFTQQVDEIVEIDPDLSNLRILESATKYIVDYLEAQSASVRIYDPQTEQMLSYGSYPSQEETRETYIPLEGSVAGEVVKTRRTFLVSNLQREILFKDKGAIKKKGVYSMMAVPLEIPRFFPRERDTVGVIQIYFPEKDREFAFIEVQAAEVMARRLSFAIARKKILSLNRLNEKKEAIVQKIFLKLSTREGIKMKDVFNRTIPELADIINIQSCALFSVLEDRSHVILEAGYPETEGYHGIGKKFPIKSEPAFELILNLREHLGESAYDMVTPSYYLVMDPQKSIFLSDRLKQFARDQNINSILYVPLNTGEAVTHFMTFDALEQRKRYDEDEIEIFLFLGRELMKAQRMEQLDDILHDFKNPAIATAGFARRLKKLLEQKGRCAVDPEIMKSVGILIEETTRLQELALSVYEVGKEQVVDLTERLKWRFEINEQAIKEQLKQNIKLTRGPFHEPLYVKCYPLNLERVLDNLLNNATNAIPMMGGILSIRTYEAGGWACAEISNTGQIPEEDRLRLLEGEGRGRGLHITNRIVRLLKGKIEVNCTKDMTTFVIRLPLWRMTSASEGQNDAAPREEIDVVSG